MEFYIFIYFQVASDWLYVYPRGIRDFLIQVKEKYNNPLIYITENGTQINYISHFFLFCTIERYFYIWLNLKYYKTTPYVILYL
jgi:hypothetical protein